MTTKRRNKRKMGKKCMDARLSRPMRPGQDPGFKPVSLQARTENQKLYIKAMNQNDITFVTGPAGTGKAQPLDSDILTPTGWVRMGDIKVGDTIIGKDGKETKVLNVYPQGIKQVYKLTFSDRTTVECCLEHLWCVRRHNGPWGPKDLKTIMATLGDTKKCYEIPMISPVEFTSKIQEIDPYLLGLLLGDGGMSRKHCIRYTSVDNQLINAVKVLLPYGHTIKVCDDDITYRLCKGTSCNSISKLLERLNLCGLNSKEKFIPDCYLYGSIKQRIKIMQGLIDTDGYVKGHVVEYSTSSKQLADGFVFLVQSLGGKATLSIRTPIYTYKGEKKQGSKAYRINVSLPSGILPCRLKRKLDDYTPRSRYQPKRFLRSVEKTDMRKCQCISVSANDNLYITDNCIVTHNTHVAIGKAVQLIREESLDRLIITRPLVSVGKDMGFLPGDIDSKVGPYIQPCFDELNYYLSLSLIGSWQREKKIEIVPLSMMRGRTFNNAFVLLDEAQNATRDEIKTLLTRIGDPSRLVVVGDTKQSDLHSTEEGAFSEATRRLEGMDGFKHISLGTEDIVRHRLIGNIIKRLW